MWPRKLRVKYAVTVWLEKLPQTHMANLYEYGVIHNYIQICDNFVNTPIKSAEKHQPQPIISKNTKFRQVTDNSPPEF